MKYSPTDYLQQSNLLPHANHFELSHHLAHVWSSITHSSFNKGLVVVMDGMGESYKDMQASLTSNGDDPDNQRYMNDLKLIKQTATNQFVQVPAELKPHVGYREAESAYVFEGTNITPIFKRWTQERSPSELYNHGFENMESLGAVYSRISSQIFGDWNACGKVMGLAPWADREVSMVQDWY